MRGDVFIITELGLHIDKQNLPALQENTWLVTDTSGTKDILIYAEGIWGITLLMYYQSRKAACGRLFLCHLPGHPERSRGILRQACSEILRLRCAPLRMTETGGFLVHS